ncbi:IucA/IucC family protein [Zhongshania sp.]|uniref:IucA/IucC family protein n=1 Tax=Zhongshania sp. TaxID=1971902 RepID=UPI0035650C87
MCYITCRIIDACLRENVFGLLDNAVAIEAPAQIQKDPDVTWLLLKIGQRELLLPVRPTRYMQFWRGISDYWFEKQLGRWEKRSGYTNWLALLGAGEDEATQKVIRDYCQEADTAVLHRRHCHQAYQDQIEHLGQKVTNISQWQHRMLFGEQVAAFQDHPYYPTARAKSGFDEVALRLYAPEFAPSFQLRWLAVRRTDVTQTSQVPACWPSFSDTGLPADLAVSHQLFPVHPLTWDALTNLPQGVVRAPNAVLTVRPTLSVRTVMVESEPQFHIKLPLFMRSLGNKNVRLIKASTLYDGHRFSRLLMAIAHQDHTLTGRYQHCDEQHGAHIGEEKQLAYIVRRYPQSVCDNNRNCLVPVAALASEMPDGRLYLQDLIDAFYDGNVDAWLKEYLDLMVGVHLRLWLVYGIALEANQQNAVLVFDCEQALTLLMKDNDAARLWPARFCGAMPSCSADLAQFIDTRILVDDELPLAQMFTTITLQLNITAIFEVMIDKSLVLRENVYGALQQTIARTLNALAEEGVEVAYAKQHLLESELLYVKYLLSAGSLMTKRRSGAADINKFYGLSAPNFLRVR